MMDPAGCHVGVAGMGPVGMTAALMLARKGYRVTVFEEGSDLSTESRASTFHPPSLEILDSLGIADELMATGLKAPMFQFRGRDRSLIATMDLTLLSEHTAFPFRVQNEQSSLTRIIRRHLEDAANVTLRFGARVAGVEHGSQSVSVYLEGDAPHQPTLTVDWLIAADGASSAVRRSLGIAFEGVTYPERFLVISTHHPFEDEIPGLAPVSYIYDPSEWGVLLRTPRHWRVLFPIQPHESDADVLAEPYLQRKLQTVSPDVQQFEIVHASVYAVNQRVASTFAQGRVLLAGDAAHINNPLGGLGMNSGIHDAEAAVMAIDATVDGCPTTVAAHAYSTVRRSAARDDVQRSTHRNYEEMKEQDARSREEAMRAMREYAVDPHAAREHMLKTSMLEMHRANRAWLETLLVDGILASGDHLLRATASMRTVVADRFAASTEPSAEVSDSDEVRMAILDVPSDPAADLFGWVRCLQRARYAAIVISTDGHLPPQQLTWLFRFIRDPGTGTLGLLALGDEASPEHAQQRAALALASGAAGLWSPEELPSSLADELRASHPGIVLVCGAPAATPTTI